MNPDLAPLLEGFFTKRLINQRRVSPHTVASYRDTFRLLLKFASAKLRRGPANLGLADVDAPLVADFLNDLEKGRGCSVRSRNQRLAAIRSFFHYAIIEAPQHAGLAQRVFAIPSKRTVRRTIGYLERAEIEALLNAVDRDTWIGRRNHALLLVMVQTGLRLSEVTGVTVADVELQAGAHIRCEGKGRKQRSTPLAKSTVAVLTAWTKEIGAAREQFLFPSTRGGRLSADAVHRLLKLYASRAQDACTSLARKRITPHVLRHTAAMELLQAGIDRSLIAIWLGHESVETTQVYLDASLAMKTQLLARTRPFDIKPTRFQPNDQLLAFLQAL
jgi:integrase/recombinase XerD